MKKIHPAAWMRAVTVAAGLCLAALDCYVIPTWGWAVAHSSPELNVYFWPWLAFAWLTSAPIYAALAALWRLSVEFKKERPITERGARSIRMIARLAAGDSAFTLAGIFVLGELTLCQPGVMLLLVFAAMLGFAVAAVAAAFADAFKRAGQLTTEN